MRFTAVFSTAMALAVGANAAGRAASEVVNNVNGITDISSDTDDIAKSISVTNMFQTAPQVVNNFKRIVEMVSEDINAMKSKRDLTAADSIVHKVQARQECLDVTDIEQCVNDLGEIIDDPSEILGRRDVPADAAKKVQGILERRDVPADAAKKVQGILERRDVPADAAKKVQGILERRDVPADAAKKVQGILERRDVPADAAKKVQGILERRDVPDVGGVAQNPGQILGGRKRNAPGYSDIEQSQICDAFRSFVQVHQALLKTVIGKHGLLSLTPFTQPIATILRTLEGGVDTIAFGIIDLVPTCAEGAINDKNNLDSTLQEAQDTYN